MKIEVKRDDALRQHDYAILFHAREQDHLEASCWYYGDWAHGRFGGLRRRDLEALMRAIAEELDRAAVPPTEAEVAADLAGRPKP